MHRRRDAIKHSLVRFDNGSSRLRPLKGRRVLVPRAQVGPQMVDERARGREVGDRQRLLSTTLSGSVM